MLHLVHLLVHECTFADGLEDLAALTGHSCLTPVAELARDAAVGRLVLVHFNALGYARISPVLDALIDQLVEAH